MSVAIKEARIKKLRVSSRASKKMTIKDRSVNQVVPNNIGADQFEAVELKADDDCEVIFDLGIGLILKKNQSQLVMFPNNGTYHFRVEYLFAHRHHRKAQLRRAASTTRTNVIATQTMPMTAHVVSGPTGDIHVP